MKIKHLFSVSCLAVTVFAASPSVEGALLAYEGFDYETGSLTGNGGTGWTDGWGGGTPMAVVTPGLGYTGLPTTGNAAADNNNGVAMGNLRKWSAPFIDTTNGTATDGSELWFSVLLNVGTSSDLRFYILSNASSEPVTDNQNVGFRINAGVIEAVINGAITSTGVSLSNGVTGLLVGRISFSDTANSDTLSLWLNPAIQDTLVPTGAIASVTGDIHSDRLKIPTLGFRGGGGFTGTVDEIRIGTTFNDVVAVPEPATLTVVLAGLGVLGMVRRKRS
jgi:hypothetical protein